MRLSPGLVAMPVAPQERIEIPLADALDRLRELALKRQATPLAVGDHAEADVVLQADRRINRRVLDPLELGQPISPRLEQLAWPEETANDISARRDHGTNLRARQRRLIATTETLPRTPVQVRYETSPPAGET
jgi:hypothetical protein